MAAGIASAETIASLAIEERPRYDPAAIATTAERRNADRADLVDSRDHADIRLDVALAAHAWLGAGDVAGLLDRTLGHRAS